MEDRLFLNWLMC